MMTTTAPDLLHSIYYFEKGRVVAQARAQARARAMLSPASACAAHLNISPIKRCIVAKKPLLQGGGRGGGTQGPALDAACLERRSYFLNRLRIGDSHAQTHIRLCFCGKV